MNQLGTIIAVGAWIHANWAGILVILSALYGLLAAIVKVCPTLDRGLLLEIIKVLAKITNNQTADEEIRAAQEQKQTK